MSNDAAFTPLADVPALIKSLYDRIEVLEQALERANQLAVKDQYVIATQRDQIAVLEQERDTIVAAAREAAEWLESRPDYTEGDAAVASRLRGAITDHATKGVEDAQS